MNLEQADKYDQLTMAHVQAKRDAMIAYCSRNINQATMNTYTAAYALYRAADDELFCFVASNKIGY